MGADGEVWFLAQSVDQSPVSTDGLSLSRDHKVSRAYGDRSDRAAPASFIREVHLG